MIPTPKNPLPNSMNIPRQTTSPMFIRLNNLFLSKASKWNFFEMYYAAFKCLLCCGKYNYCPLLKIESLIEKLSFNYGGGEWKAIPRDCRIARGWSDDFHKNVMIRPLPD